MAGAFLWFLGEYFSFCPMINFDGVEPGQANRAEVADEVIFAGGGQSFRDVRQVVSDHLLDLFLKSDIPLRVIPPTQRIGGCYVRKVIQDGTGDLIIWCRNAVGHAGTMTGSEIS
jgi:hypothetical protein